MTINSMSRMAAKALAAVGICTIFFCYHCACADGYDTGAVNSIWSTSTNRVEKPSKIIVDPKSHKSAVVDSTKTIITLFDKKGKKIWSVDVLSQINKPIVGKGEIRDVKFSEGNVIVTVGKHTFVSINSETGIMTFLGSD